MKKMLSFITIFAIVLCLCVPVFAVDEFDFELQYTGTIVKNIEKDAKVLLVGNNATLHTNVQIKIDITGPATPKILATDSTGVEHDIAQLGYWGPASGFAVQGDFTNTTPIKATFTEEGEYTIKLSLIDVANGNAVIASDTFEIQVYEDESATPPANIENVIDNAIQELPKTGTSVVEYVIYSIAIVLIISIVGIYLNKKRMNA